MWQIQKRHIKCIQDVPGCPLYTEVDQVQGRNGKDLSVYRCARGSTSLESFHLHLQRFVPGMETLNTNADNHDNQASIAYHVHLYYLLFCIVETRANDVHFQCYLVEGLARWNDNRALQALQKDAPSSLMSHNTAMKAAYQELALELFQQPLHPEGRKVASYIGIGHVAHYIIIYTYSFSISINTTLLHITYYEHYDII